MTKSMRCDWCGPFGYFENYGEVKPLSAACVHEHIVTLNLCPLHAMRAQRSDLTFYCEPCRKAGVEEVPVKVLSDLS